MAKSLAKITFILLEKDIDVIVKQITNKMLSLKNYFFDKRQKENAVVKKIGSGPYNLYISTWQFYRDLGFLKYSFMKCQTESNLKRTHDSNKVSRTDVRAKRPPVKI